jgi:hypothetical protein
VSFDFGESSLDYICPVSPLQKYILLLRIFPVTPVSLDFGESSLDYICPVSPLQKYILHLHIFPVTPVSLDFGESLLDYLAAQAGNASTIDGLTSRRNLRTVASRNAKQFHLLSLSTISRAPKMSCGACRAGKSWA